MSLCTEAPTDFIGSLDDAAALFPGEMARLSPLVTQSLERDPDARPSNTHSWVAMLDEIIATMVELEDPVWLSEPATA